MPIESSQNISGATRPTGAVDTRIATSAVESTTVNPATTPTVTTTSTPQTTTLTTPAATQQAAATYQASGMLSAGPVPHDQDRVEQVRKAVQNGTYPLVPTKISDAIIAAGYLLQKGQ